MWIQEKSLSDLHLFGDDVLIVPADVEGLNRGVPRKL